MYRDIFISLILINSFLFASNGFKSEFSHFAGGLVITALVAFIVFNYFPKYKIKSILIGFVVSMVYVAVDQMLDYIKDGKFLGQLFDFTMHSIGSAISAYIGYQIIKK